MRPVHDTGLPQPGHRAVWQDSTASGTVEGDGRFGHHSCLIVWWSPQTAGMNAIHRGRHKMISNTHFLLCEHDANKGFVDGTFGYDMPAARCEVCKQITLSPFQDRPDVTVDPAGLFTHDWLVSRDEYLSVVEEHPGLRGIPAGTSFGVFSGTAKGKLGDIAWSNGGTPLFRELVAKEISSLWPAVSFFPTEIRKLRGEPLLCPYIPSFGTMAATQVETQIDATCRNCGFRRAKLTGEIIVADLPPSGVPFCRMVYFGGYFIASKEFRDFVESHQWSGAQFDELKVIDSCS